MTRILGWTVATVACLSLSACGVSPSAVIRNDSGADIVLFPLDYTPQPLASGATTDELLYSPYERHQALVERGGCLYTYPAPDHRELPQSLRTRAPSIVIVFQSDMTLSVRERSNEGQEGPEIRVAGFPLKPEVFCGRSERG